jgi:hypothetical protein
VIEPDRLPDETPIHVLVSPDGYEMVIPIFNKSMTKVGWFVGMDTVKVYDEAKVRAGRDIGGLKMHIRLTNWAKVAQWFSFTPASSEILVGVCMNWMIGVAEGAAQMGHESESIIDLEVANMAVGMFRMGGEQRGIDE